MIINQMIW